MSFRKQIPKPRAVFDDPNAHFEFLTVSSDVDFEGQHFERKETCRARSDGNVAPSDLKKIDEQIAECLGLFQQKSRWRSARSCLQLRGERIGMVHGTPCNSDARGIPKSANV